MRTTVLVPAPAGVQARPIRGPIKTPGALTTPDGTPFTHPTAMPLKGLPELGTMAPMSAASPVCPVSGFNEDRTPFTSTGWYSCTFCFGSYWAVWKLETCCCSSYQGLRMLKRTPKSTVRLDLTFQLSCPYHSKVW